MHNTILCGNAHWRKPYSRGFDSLSNEYSFRENKSKLKNRSMPVCISLDLSSYEKGGDTKEAKRSIKVTRKVGAQVSHEFVHKSVTHSLVHQSHPRKGLSTINRHNATNNKSQSPIVWCNAKPVLNRDASQSRIRA